jgi:hypothetical protein
MIGDEISSDDVKWDDDRKKILVMLYMSVSN